MTRFLFYLMFMCLVLFVNCAMAMKNPAGLVLSVPLLAACLYLRPEDL